MTFEYLPKYIYLINILNRYMDFLSCNKDIRRYLKKKKMIAYWKPQYLLIQ